MSGTNLNRLVAGSSPAGSKNFNLIHKGGVSVKHLVGLEISQALDSQNLDPSFELLPATHLKIGRSPLAPLSWI